MVVGTSITANAEYAISSDNGTHLVVDLLAGKQKSEIPNNVIADAAALDA
jgi:hypothetical protein